MSFAAEPPGEPYDELDIGNTQPSDMDDAAVWGVNNPTLDTLSLVSMRSETNASWFSGCADGAFMDEMSHDSPNPVWGTCIGRLCSIGRPSWLKKGV